MTLPQFPANKSRPLSVLAFDYGTQRIGVAFGQSITGTAQGVSVIKANDGIPDWDEIAALIKQWKPTVFVVGLPYNMDGTESELSARAEKFANRLNGRFSLPSFGMDERLSSREARAQLHEQQSTGRGQPANAEGKKRAAIDDIAAQIILENWFTELRMQSGNR